MMTNAAAFISGIVIPLDVLVRIVSYLTAPIDLQCFSRTCSAARHAVADLRELRELRHVRIGGAIAIVDENADPDRGLELAWIEGDSLIQAPLGLTGHQGINTPVSSVQSVKFTPDGNFIGMIVVFRRDVPPVNADAVERLRGMNLWTAPNGSYVRQNYEFHPASDCTVQIVELVRKGDGTPDRIELYTLSHRFVPEFGFDFVWVSSPDPEAELHYSLAFASVVHTQSCTMLL
eukprot:IDg4876t1